MNSKHATRLVLEKRLFHYWTKVLILGNLDVIEFPCNVGQPGIFIYNQKTKNKDIVNNRYNIKTSQASEIEPEINSKHC